MTNRFWCDQVWLGGDRAAERVLIEVAGNGLISSVTPDVESPPDALHLDGLTLPGFANGHSHAFHRLLRGRTNRGAGDFWTWREEMYRAAAQLDPDSYHELAKRVFSEMVAAGFTLVGEFHYLHHSPNGTHYQDPNAMGEALAAAAETVGIRLTLLDTLYLHGGLDGTYLPPDSTQRRFSDRSAENWLVRWEKGLRAAAVKRGVAIHSVRAVDPGSMKTIAGVADELGLVVHAHVSEQPGENAASLAVHGRTPTELFLDAGLLNERFTAVHATHLTPFDIRALGEAGATVCLCPTTERDLADGIAPTPELVAAGCRLSLGSDSQAVIDPFEESRAIELNQRLRTLRRGNHTPTSLLTAATAEGYRSLGWPEGGAIEVGRLADMVTVSFESDRLAMISERNRIEGALFAATASDVNAVVIGGTLVRESK